VRVHHDAHRIDRAERVKAIEAKELRMASLPRRLR
jgi:hypothetical protein